MCTCIKSNWHVGCVNYFQFQVLSRYPFADTWSIPIKKKLLLELKTCMAMNKWLLMSSIFISIFIGYSTFVNITILFA